MLYSHTLIPLLHGEVGILDELLLFGAPLTVVIIILVMASRRARRTPPRVRTSQETAGESLQPNDASASSEK